MNDALAYFTGREDQIAAYDRLWNGDTPWILCFDGPSGSGKSTLLDWLIANRCRPAPPGRLEATPHALLDLYSSPMRQWAPLLNALFAGLRAWLPPAACARYGERRQAILEDLDRQQVAIQPTQTITAGGGGSVVDVQQQMRLGEVMREIERHARDALTAATLDLLEVLPERAALFLDTYEALGRSGDAEWEGWLWDGLIGPARAQRPGLRVVVAGRDRLRLPGAARACSSSRLGDFSPSECDAFLRQRAIEEGALRARIYDLTGGHPLLAGIAADAWGLGREGDLPLTLAELDAAPQAEGLVEEWLYGRILDRLEPALRDAGRYGILLRRFDRSALNAIFVPESPALDEGAFRRFAGLAFVERRAEGGYRAHDRVRRAQLAWLRRADPDLLADWMRRFEVYYGRRYERRGEPDDLTEALYHRCWRDEEGAIEAWEGAVEAHTLVADRERWRGVVRVLEGPEWAEKPLHPETRVRYHYRRGRWHYYNAEWDAALGSYEEALGLFRQVGSRLGEANTLQAIGDVQNFRKELDAALGSYEEALGLFRQVGDRLGEANIYVSLAMIDGARERIEDMRQHYERALALYQAIGDGFSVGRSLVYYGDALLAAGEEEEAKRRYVEALRAWLARGLDDLIGQHLVPRLVRACGSVEAAQAYLRGVSG